ncbi:hypothetical protein E5288_WYG002372 [Bos mutus]|uniref:Uncharacterized protein n=1 Tax=Bos mutus TaxID=72004 RepID=A0A6B0R6I5_9CETA|nr:hypothetical protein [Bos mutus]
MAAELPTAWSEVTGNPLPSNMASPFLEGYHLRRPRLLTQEELRTRKRRLLQDTCADQNSQLKTKETTAERNKVWEKPFTGRKGKL